MDTVRHALTPALIVGLPLAVGVALLTNTVDLGNTLTLLLVAVAVAVPTFVALRADERSRGVATRSWRGRRSSHAPSP